jgi:hypothetical protein
MSFVVSQAAAVYKGRDGRARLDYRCASQPGNSIDA